MRFLTSYTHWLIHSITLQAFHPWIKNTQNCELYKQEQQTQWFSLFGLVWFGFKEYQPEFCGLYPGYYHTSDQA